MSNNNKNMGVISTNNNEITLYIHTDNRLAKQSIAVAEASKAITKVVNLEEVQLTETQWADLADLLKVKVDDLINFDHEIITSKLGKNIDVEPNQLLKLLSHNQAVIKHGIAIRGNKAIFITQINDLMQLQESDSGDVKIP
ncbi:ArsC family transcriptional regulator [Psychroflexus sp. ALD_RP9]|uniref:ArsC family transcriptional regulator n=1 Tax=Psychroflexus sp. ALD_RP9 TaxID=2777186 RepID=UPI001A8ED8C5|nr:ArsC family transcriptional regulator [Psychroflexus sp. ALD_RP9]QSS97056.1 ArsC family transcriptional regulator [Psychroflexus sp. ALD_RP9]